MWLLSCICRRRLPLSLSSLLGRKLVSNCWQMSFRLRGRLPALRIVVVDSLAASTFPPFFVHRLLHTRTVSRSLLICRTSVLSTFYCMCTCVFFLYIPVYFICLESFQPRLHIAIFWRLVFPINMPLDFCSRFCNRWKIAKLNKQIFVSFVCLHLWTS